jgi:hypothetical protein
MARKRQEKNEMPAVSAEPELKPVRIDLAAAVHRLLRLVAADSEVSMASYARTALETHLRDEAKRRGIKG